MFAPEHIAQHAQFVKEAEAKLAALDPNTLKMLLAGGAGAIAGGVPTYLMTRAHDEAERERTRSHSYGAGVATGVAAPHIVRGLFNIAQRNGFLPQEMPQGVMG